MDRYLATIPCVGERKENLFESNSLFDELPIQTAFDSVVAQFGPWTAHNLLLAEGLYTISSSKPLADEYPIRVIEEWLPSDWSQMRMLDLACLEGGFAIGFAKRGARVVGIEGRKQNLVKADFVRRRHKLDNLQLYLDDVKNFSVTKYGSFDVIFCRGILYHLEAESVFRLVERMFESCRGILILDTHYIPDVNGYTRNRITEDMSHLHRGEHYQGKCFIEHSEQATEADREKELWSALSNNSSFWPTKESLLRLLANSGFCEVSEYNPRSDNPLRDRGIFIAKRRGSA